VGIAHLALDGRWLWTNAKFCEILGYSQEELLGRTLQDITHPDDFARDKAQLDQLLAGEIKGYSMEKRYVRKDSSLVWASMTRGLVRDPRGEPKYILTIVQDISRRMQAEEDVASLARFPGENPNPVIRISKDGTVLYRNEAAEPLLKAWGHADGRPIAAEWQRYVLEGLSSGEVLTAEAECGTRVYSVTFAPVVESGYSNAYGLDITQRKEAERRLQRMQQALRRTNEVLERRVQRRTEELSRALDSLRESEERFRATFEQAAVGMGLVDLDGRFLRTNRKLCEILGYSQDELLKLRFHDVTHLDDLGADLEGVRRLLAGETQSFSVEKRHVRKDGTAVWTDLTASLVRGRDGKPEGFIGAVEDITARKRAEEALQESEEQYRATFEQSGVGVAHVAPDGRYLRVNQKLCDMVGYTREELLERRFLDITHPDDRESDAERTQRLLAGEIQGYLIEKRYIRKDGATVWASLAGTLMRDPDGKARYFISVIQDVTERKRAEEALRQQSRIQEAFFKHSLTPLVFLDRDFNFIRVNEAYAKACARDVSEFPGHNHFEFYPSDAKPIFEEVVRTKTPYRTFGRPFVFADHPEWGTTYWDWELVPLLDERGEVEFLVFSLEDVTARKKAEGRVNVTNDLLRLFARTTNRKGYLEAVVKLLGDFTGCPHAGIRMLNERGEIPYEASIGFTPEFLESECWLQVERDQCACTRVVSARPKPQDGAMMTPGGSFCCNNTFEFVGGLSEKEKASFRGVCVVNGFASVAVVPIRYQGMTLGAVHLAADKPDMVPQSTVEFIESVTPLVGEAIYRINMEDALRDSEERLRAVVTSAPVVVWAVDRNGVFTLAEGTGLSHMGFRPGELVGRSAFDVARERPEMQQHVNRALAGELVSETMTLGRASWDMRYSPLKDADGEVLGVIGVATDVTERRRAEEELRKLNEALEERAAQLRELALDLTRVEQRERRRLAEVLHDNLQQLLAVAKLRVAMLASGVQQEEMRDALGQITRLLEDSIRASRTLTAELSAPILYEAGLARALEWLARQMEASYGLDVQVAADADAEPDGEDLCALLFQCVRELLFNVLKHAGVGTACVRMGRFDGDQVRIEVEDEGTGFEPAQLQVEGIPSEGFGLYSIRQRVSLVGGRMEVDSAPGKGTRVRLFAPIRQPAEAQPRGRRPARDPAGRGSAGDGALADIER
jgi:PAS domain S-box-containing protein